MGRLKENLSEGMTHVPGMGIFTLAGVFFLVIALILLGYSSRSQEEMNNIPSRFKGIYAFLILLGIFLIAMDNLDRIFPYPP
jgi:membrane-bound ClpP family serine protease